MKQKKYIKSIFFYLIISCISFASGMQIDRVILAVNDNPDYIDFWPMTAKAWSKMGIKPTLAFIADKNAKIDESLGDVIRFEPSPDLPTATHAQCIRLLLPSYFEDDVCIMADIDMIPLKKSFFFDPIKNTSNDSFVSYCRYEKDFPIHPICYHAGKGKTFKEIFDIKNTSEILPLIKHWYYLSTKLHTPPGYKYTEKEWREKLIWTTDERMLTGYKNRWKNKDTRLIQLNYPLTCKENTTLKDYNTKLLKENFYNSIDLPKNYKKNKAEIDKFLQEAGLEDLMPS